MPTIYLQFRITRYIFLMRQTIMGLFAVGALFMQSCSADMENLTIKDNIATPEIDATTENYQKGVLRVKLSASLCESIENEAARGELLLKDILSAELDDIAILSSKRLFPHAGKFEKRTREMGMHLWYVVKFDPTVPTTRVTRAFTKSDNVLQIEQVPVIVHYKAEVMPDYAGMVRSAASRQEGSEMPFNDPMLPEQWHYKNEGLYPNYLPSADVNVHPVWKNNLTGNPEVIVCVVDNGVDYLHADLRDNIYINQAELAGAAGEDSDNNGYVDDIYGYNFVDDTAIIERNDHATHVAGVIAAVNNNGIGVSGMAGGDGTPNSGVKIMIAQIFTKTSSSDGTVAIKYGADNGAVISQNSWGYPNLTDTPETDRLAIEYFRKYAGVDENGEQTGPIRGGIVVFATGNESRPYSSPGSCELAVSVTGIAPNFTKANYSNYGYFATLAAPGGSVMSDFGADSRGGILSTTTDDTYRRMQGTSMACPHVSGAFALLVSQVANSGKKGVTGEEMIQQLVNNSRPIDNYNPLYEGQLGGLVDIYRATGGNSQHAPEAVTDFAITSYTHTAASFKWSVPNDEDDLTNIGFRIYYSTERLQNIDFDRLPATVQYQEVGEYVPGVGQEMITRIRGLQPSTSYYFAIQAYDFSGNRAPLSNEAVATMLDNKAPVITAREGNELYVKTSGTARLRFDISDPENEDIEVSFEVGSNAESYVLANNTVTFFVNGAATPVGSYNSVMTVTDKYNAQSKQNILYHIVEESAPEKTENELSSVEITGIAQTYSLKWTDYIVDKDGDVLEASITVADESIASAVIDGNDIVFTTKAYGTTTCVLEAKDRNNPAVQIEFTLTCKREGEQPALELQMYPNPVRDQLNIKANESATGQLKVYSASGSTVLTMENMELKSGVAQTINMKELRAGQYVVQFESNGKSIKKTITKI